MHTSTKTMPAYKEGARPLKNAEVVLFVNFDCSEALDALGSHKLTQSINQSI